MYAFDASVASVLYTTLRVDRRLPPQREDAMEKLGAGGLRERFNSVSGSLRFVTLLSPT